MEDLRINSLGSGKFQKGPKFQCPRNMVRVKSGNLLKYRVQAE